MRNSRLNGRTARTALDAAAASMARGASGFGLRAGSRLGLACRGMVYLLVGYLAFRLALASHARAGAPASSAGAVQAAVAPAWRRIPLVLLVAGLLVVAGGVEAGRRAIRLNFRERFTAEHMPRALAILTRVLGAAGSAGRAVVLVLTGAFLIKAAVLSRATQGKGLDAVFRAVASTPYGPWLLALLACSLFCYGLYCLVEVRYRDLTPGQ